MLRWIARKTQVTTISGGEPLRLHSTPLSTPARSGRETTKQTSVVSRLPPQELIRPEFRPTPMLNILCVRARVGPPPVSMAFGKGIPFWRRLVVPALR